MFERDYLMRMLFQFFEALMRSWTQAHKDKDPQRAAENLEDAVGEATEIDGASLLALEPDSLVSVLEVSGTDPKVIEYVARSIALAGVYQRQAGNEELADLRAAQAQALSEAYELDMPEDPEDFGDLIDELPEEQKDSAILEFEETIKAEQTTIERPIDEQPDDNYTEK